MSKIDCLMIQPNAAAKIYQDLHKNHSALEPPIWAAMIAKHCQVKGFSVAILDCEVERITDQEAAETIKYLDPRIACVVCYGQQPSSSSQNMEGAISLANEIRKISPTIKIMFIGGHIAALPEETLSYDCVDFIAQNEGVYTTSSLLSVDDLDDYTILEHVQGLGWKREGHIILNPIGKIVPQERLDVDLPGMAWDLLPPLSKYRTAGWHSWPNKSIKSPFASLYTSLGCPFKCSFCCINMINRTDNTPGVTSDKSATFRYWQPEFIINQFEYLANQGVRNVKIADEMFVLREPHFMRLCELIAERGYDFNFWAYARVDCTKPHHLKALKKAGVNFLGLGIESPNQTVRRDVIKGGFQEMKIVDVVRLIQEAGIGVGANYILGLPEDTTESMQETLDFAIDMNTENCNLYSTMAYAGSPLYNQAKEKGWHLPDCYAGFSQHSWYTQNLPSNYLTAAEILKFRDEAHIKYFSNPAHQKLLAETYGEEAAANVRDTLTIKLKRRLLGDEEPQV